MMKQIHEMDATELAAAIATKQIRSTEALRAFIEQIEKFNPTVNALVDERYEKAFCEAVKADEMIEEGVELGLLHGVPMSMKESFHVEGMQTTGGLLRRKGMIQHKDAEVVRRLKNEGAIILGKTNTPELCFCQETDNKLYGRTNNPHDLTKTAGGSSGGEAALIASNGAAVGIGSDIGGSIRFPSHFNGVTGFKSGNGQVSSDGSYPNESHPLQDRMLGIGPIAKSVRDVRFLYQIIAKNTVKQRDLKTCTVNVLPDTRYPLSLETGHFLQSLSVQSEKAFQVEREIPPHFDESARLWQEIMSINGAEGPQKEVFGEHGGNPYKEYAKEWLTGRSELHRYLSWAFIGAGLFKPSPKRIREIEELIRSGDALLVEYLEDRLLVFPVYHTSAPAHGQVYSEIFSIKKTYEIFMPYTAYANVWGLPSLTVPIDTGEDGMPIAVQVMSKNGNEEALFQYGEWLEKNFRKQ